MEAMVLGLIAIAVAAMLAPALQHGHPPSPRVRCLSNLRQIATALHQYAQQNNGVFPLRLIDVCDLGIKAKCFVCPASSTETAARDGSTPQQTITNLLTGKPHVTYVYLVGGKQLRGLSGQAVVAYEPVANHGGTLANVLFVDGHCASVPTSVLAQMIKEISAGQNPPPATSGQ